MSLASLGRVAADAEVVAMIGGGYTVYGWTHVILRPNGRGAVPVRLFVSHHTFKFGARRAAARWLTAKRQELLV